MMSQIKGKAQIFNFSAWIKDTNPNFLKERLNTLLLNSGFDVLGFQEHYFHPVGYTALWLLGESHLALHTFPEEKKSYIELSSCNPEYFQLFCDDISNEMIIEEKE
ncbi:MAG: S-adenosylmethionine decarboxylase [Leptospiraceae bacterium]|nr:S-adenosylmethionine decarboxylase [Leptospiraceae bacterium]